MCNLHTLPPHNLLLQHDAAQTHMAWQDQAASYPIFALVQRAILFCLSNT